MLVWNVFREDVNHNKIYEFNVFNHHHFTEDCKKAFKSFRGNKDKVEEEIKRCLMYNYWCKCEHEIVITGFPPSEKTSRKVDIYSQVVMNWDRFFDYLWENQNELKKMKE